jgi:pilus assembly protein Flp/PilA
MTIENRSEQEIHETTQDVTSLADSSRHELPVPVEAGDKQEQGASLVEYALLVALIAVVAIAAVRELGTSVSNQFSGISAAITG